MSPGGGQFGAQGFDLQDLCRGPLHLLHTKYISSGPHGFREEDFLSFSHYKSIGANSPLGRGQFGPQGLDWLDVCRGPLNIAIY